MAHPPLAHALKWPTRVGHPGVCTVLYDPVKYRVEHIAHRQCWSIEIDQIEQLYDFIYLIFRNHIPTIPDYDPTLPTSVHLTCTIAYKLIFACRTLKTVSSEATTHSQTTARRHTPKRLQRLPPMMPNLQSRVCSCPPLSASQPINKQFLTPPLPIWTDQAAIAHSSWS